MFRRIEARNYRCLKDVSIELNPFEVLVGANASGKSTFLDVIVFLSDFLSQDLSKAVERRTTNFHDLVWGRQETSFTLAVTVRIPTEVRALLSLDFAELYYSLTVRLDAESESFHVDMERAKFVAPMGLDKQIIDRTGAQVAFRSETTNQTFDRSRPFGISSSLNAIPMDSEFPACAWLREFLREQVRVVELNPKSLQSPSPPGRGNGSRIDGSTLARLITILRSGHPGPFTDWLAHLRTALSDIRSVDVILREEDQHRYLVVEYENGHRIPAWMVSAGTLNLLALTILAYLPDFKGAYLVEEPENGVHPLALETIFQSLSSVYEGQVLIASHSPILLSMAKPEQLLCFSKASDGGAQIVRGSDHPVLKNWQGEVSLGSLVGSGILD